MANVDGRADGAFARIEIRPDCIEGGVFYDHDHDGSGKHRRQDRVLEPVRKVLGQDKEAEGAFGSEGYLPHCLPLKRPRRRIRDAELLPRAGNRNQSLAELHFRSN
jgi:hypothetical protein